jgi:hypothetical protein
LAARHPSLKLREFKFTKMSYPYNVDTTLDNANVDTLTLSSLVARCGAPLAP